MGKKNGKMKWKLYIVVYRDCPDNDPPNVAPLYIKRILVLSGAVLVPPTY